MAGSIHVGVGGWDFDPWRGTFYPDGLPELRRILIGAGQQGLGGPGDDILRPAEIGKALPQVHRPMLDGERRHAGEDVGRHVGEKRVHSLAIKAKAAAGLRTFAAEMKKR